MYKKNNLTNVVFDNNLNVIEPNTTEWDSYRQFLENGGTPELVDHIESGNSIMNDLYTEGIQSRFKYLKTRALSSSMNKSSNDYEFLLHMREVYEKKYEVSKFVITSGVVYDNVKSALEKEMADEFDITTLTSQLTGYGLTPSDGSDIAVDVNNITSEEIHLSRMYQLVRFKFEAGEAKYYPFLKFCEEYRTKSLLWLQTNEHSKIEQGFSLVDNLPKSMTVAEAQTQFDLFDAI